MTPWEADFTQPNFGFSWGVQEKAPGRHLSVADPLGQYDRVGQITVLVGDNNVAGSGTGERTEALIPPGGYGVEGSEEWWAHSVVYADPFTPTTSDWNVTTQWHNSGTTGGTTAFVTAGRQIKFKAFGGDPANPQNTDWVLVDGFVPMRRYELVLHVLWSADKTKGFVECYVDGKVVLPKTAHATLYTGETVYFKQGYYRAAAALAQVGWDAKLWYHGTCLRPSLADAVAHAFPKSDRWNAAPVPVPVPPTVSQQVDAIEKSLRATTITYPDYQSRVNSGFYTAKGINPADTNWGKAFAGLEALRA